MNNQPVKVTTDNITPRRLRLKTDSDGVVAQKQDRPLALLVAKIRHIMKLDV